MNSINITEQWYNFTFYLFEAKLRKMINECVLIKKSFILPLQEDNLVDIFRKYKFLYKYIKFNFYASSLMLFPMFACPNEFTHI